MRPDNIPQSCCAHLVLGWDRLRRTSEQVLLPLARNSPGYATAFLASGCRGVLRSVQMSLAVGCPPRMFTSVLLTLRLRAGRHHAVISPRSFLRFDGRIDVPHLSLPCWHWPKPILLVPVIRLPRDREPWAFPGEQTYSRYSSHLPIPELMCSSSRQKHCIFLLHVFKWEERSLATLTLIACRRLKAPSENSVCLIWLRHSRVPITLLCRLQGLLQTATQFTLPGRRSGSQMLVSHTRTQCHTQLTFKQQRW